MELRFPAPSSDNAIPLDGSNSGTAPVSPKSPGFHAPSPSRRCRGDDHSRGPRLQSTHTACRRRLNPSVPGHCSRERYPDRYRARSESREWGQAFRLGRHSPRFTAIRARTDNGTQVSQVAPPAASTHPAPAFASSLECLTASAYRDTLGTRGGNIIVSRQGQEGRQLRLGPGRLPPG